MNLINHGVSKNTTSLKNIVKIVNRSLKEKQLSFTPCVGTTDVIFILRQLQKKYLAKKRICNSHLQDWGKLLIEFLGCFAACWDVRKLGVEEFG